MITAVRLPWDQDIQSFRVMDDGSVILSGDYGSGLGPIVRMSPTIAKQSIKIETTDFKNGEQRISNIPNIFIDFSLRSCTNYSEYIAYRLPTNNINLIAVAHKPGKSDRLEFVHMYGHVLMLEVIKSVPKNLRGKTYSLSGFIYSTDGMWKRDWNVAFSSHPITPEKLATEVSSAELSSALQDLLSKLKSSGIIG